MSKKRAVVYDSSDEASIAKAEKAQKDIEKDLDWIMSSSRGRRWVHDMIYSRCHIDGISHVPRDTHSTAFNEGARSVGQALLDDLRTSYHTLYIKMLEENDDRNRD